MDTDKDDAFWNAVDVFLLIQDHGDFHDPDFGSERSLADLPYLSLHPFAIEEYDRRLESAPLSHHWGQPGLEGELAEASSSEDDAELEALKERIFGRNIGERSLDEKAVVADAETEGPQHRGDESLRLESVSDDEQTADQVQDLNSQDDELWDDGGESGDEADENDGSESGEGDLEDYENSEHIQETNVRSSEIWNDELGDDDSADGKEHVEDVRTAEHMQGMDAKNDEARNNDQLTTYSCRACRKPDDDMMIACDNNEAHADDEHWHHFTCVDLTMKTVPNGEWFCPRCRLRREDSDDADHPGAMENGKPEGATQSAKQAAGESTKSISSNKKATKTSRKGQASGDGDTDVPVQVKKDESKACGSEMDDSEKPKTPKKPVGKKDGWKNPLEDQRLIELLKELQADVDVDEKIRFSEKKWPVISNRMWERYGYERTPNSVKNHYSRDLRAKAGYDERGQNHRNPDKMRTSVENPEERKRRRQAKAQAKKSSPTTHPREHEDAHEELSGGDANQQQSEKEDGHTHNQLLMGPQGLFRGDEYDFSPHKNKGKRKRNEEADEYDYSPHENKRKRQRDEADGNEP